MMLMPVRISIRLLEESMQGTHTFELLDKLRPSSEEKSPQGLGPSRLLWPEKVSPPDVMLLLVLNAVPDLLLLGNDDGIVRGLCLEAREDLEGLIVSSVVEQPPWRLRKPRHGGVQGEDKDELEGKRKSPGDGATGKGQAVVDPVAHGEAEDVHQHLEHDELASQVGG